MGGTPVITKNDYPFVVAIFYQNNYICTGTLISLRHVITAAHCFASSTTKTYLAEKCQRNPTCLEKYLGKKVTKEKCKNGYLNSAEIIKDYEIGFGSHLLKNMTRLKLESIDENYQQFYHFGCLKNDLAILTLVADGNEDNRTFATLLHTTNLNIRDDNVEAISLGWGKDPINHLIRHETLQKLDVSGVLSMKACFNSWNSIFPVDGICVLEMDDKNSCDGDSGGPLISIQGNQHILLGILSFGTDCEALRNNTKPKTAVYTRLDFYQQKLNEIIGWKNENFDGFDFSDL